jgi:hypothetical protein
MKSLNRLFFCFALSAPINSVFVNSVLAADSAKGSVTIISPKNGEALPGATGNKLEFKLSLSPSGNHVHIYVDDQDPIIDRDVSRCPCTIALPKLSSGKHNITVKEATSGHALTGVQDAVTVTVK